MFKGRKSKKQKAGPSGAAQDGEGDRPQPMGIAAQLVPELIHPWLNFSNRLTNYNMYCEKLHRLKDKDIDLPRTVDWTPLELAGVAEGIKDILKQQFTFNGQVFVYDEWEYMFGILERVYKELCIEFHSTYHMNEEVATVDDKSFINFRLGGQPRRMSMLDFAPCLGIYNRSELTGTHFGPYLLSCARMEIDFFPKDVWHEFSDKQYISGRNSYVDMNDMQLKIIQRCLAHTIAHRRENTEKVTAADMWYLRNMLLERTLMCHLLLLGIYFILLVGLEGSRPFAGGHFVTKIAKFFDISFGPESRFTRVDDRPMTVGYVMFQGANTISVINNIYRPYQPPAEGEAPAPPGR